MSAEPNGKTGWIVATSILSTLAVLVAGAWVIIDLKITNSVLLATAAKNEEISALKANAIARDALLESRLTEIETQFRAEDQLRNVQFANTLRFESLLWEGTFHTRFPSDVMFAPSIAQPGK